MDIISVSADGAVIEFYTQELRLLAEVVLHGADSDPTSCPTAEAMHAAFQALALAAAQSDGKNHPEVTWRGFEEQSEADERALAVKRWELSTRLEAQARDRQIKEIEQRLIALEAETTPATEPDPSTN